MADIYVRPYGERSKNPLRFLLPVLLLACLVGAGVWWWLGRPEPVEKPAVKPAETVAAEKQPALVATKTPPPATASKPALSTTPSVDMQRIYDQAQVRLADGRLAEATALLGEVIEKSTDSALKNNALRVQGRVNLKLFLSEVPTSEKKSYIIQPGDSLDRIARNNDTTIELIRAMNGIKGNLIYPAARLLLPAEPFTVLVHKTDRLLDLKMGDKLFKRYSVGVGRYGKTPLGTFYTVVHQENPDWTPPSGGIIPFGDPRNELGTRWMSIENKQRPDLRGFGIHGTADRGSIGGETSNGCIRMLNEDVEELFLLIPRGTKVVIQE